MLSHGVPANASRLGPFPRYRPLPGCVASWSDARDRVAACGATLQHVQDHPALKPDTVHRVNFLAIPAWLLPFGLAVVFEAQTRYVPDILANFFHFNGRWLFPFAYLNRYWPDVGLERLLPSGTHAWDVLFWVVVSIAFGLLTRRMPPRRAWWLAPVVVIALAFAIHVIAAWAGLVFYGRSFRVVG
jgi:hypothetical protein